MNIVATLALAISVVSPQSAPQPPPASCRVQILSASYMPSRNSEPMLDPKSMDATRVFGTLRVRYRNNSGKAIRQVHMAAHFAPRTGVAPPLYKQPDPNAQDFTLDGAAAGTEKTASLRVKVDASSLLMLEATGITYADGSTETTAQGSDGSANCAYTPAPAIKPAGR